MDAETTRRILKWLTLSFVGLFVAAVVTIPALLWLQDYIETSELGEEIKRRTDHDSGVFVSLTPDPFPLQSSREDVLSVLEDNDFKRDPGGETWTRYQEEIDSGKQLYVQIEDNVLCRYGHYVLVDFDGSGRLVSAAGTFHRLGCL